MTRILSTGKACSKGNGRIQTSSSAGFTLIELIVVMLLIGFLAALTAPAISRSLKGLKLKEAVRKLLSVVRHTRERAILEQLPYSLRFNLEEDQYMTAQGFPGEVADSELKEVALFTLPAELDLRRFRSINSEEAYEESWIAFYPDGSSSGGSVDLVSRTGKGRWHISLNPFTGLATISIGRSDGA